MKASADDTPAGPGRDDGWDETVLVWNATVARIPAPVVTRESPGERRGCLKPTPGLEPGTPSLRVKCSTS